MVVSQHCFTAAQVYSRISRADPCSQLTPHLILTVNLTSAPTLRHHEAARPPPVITMASVSGLVRFICLVEWLGSINQYTLPSSHCLLLPVLQSHLLFASCTAKLNGLLDVAAPTSSRFNTLVSS